MATPHTPRFDELLPAHALGALDGEDRAALAAHLASGCAECAAALLAWEREVEALARASPPVEPAAITRARVLARARRAGAAPRSGHAFRSWAALAAAAVVLLVAGVLHLDLRRETARLAADGAAARARAAALGEELRAAQQELERLTLATQVLGAPELRPVVLAGLDPAPAASGHAFVDPRGARALFVARDLAPAPPDRTYQLWFIAAGRAVSAGIFAVDSRGAALLLVENVAPVGEIQAWAVTVEPAGGVPQPTGAMVLKG